MITVEEAEFIFKTKSPEWGETSVHPNDGYGLKSAEPLIADRGYPSIHRSTMDGIAVAWESWSNGQRAFPIAGVCAAGIPEGALSDPQSCFEIMTGAAVPRGAQLVIPYEHLLIQNGEASVQGSHSYALFENIHKRGSDFSQGTSQNSSGQGLVTFTSAVS